MSDIPKIARKGRRQMLVALLALGCALMYYSFVVFGSKLYGKKARCKMRSMQICAPILAVTAVIVSCYHSLLHDRAESALGIIMLDGLSIIIGILAGIPRAARNTWNRECATREITETKKFMFGTDASGQPLPPPLWRDILLYALKRGIYYGQTRQ